MNRLDAMKALDLWINTRSNDNANQAELVRLGVDLGRIVQCVREDIHPLWKDGRLQLIYVSEDCERGGYIDEPHLVRLILLGLIMSGDQLS